MELSPSSLIGVLSRVSVDVLTSFFTVLVELTASVGSTSVSRNDLHVLVTALPRFSTTTLVTIFSSVLA